MELRGGPSRSAAVPLILLLVSLAGIVGFSRSLGVVATIGMLVCGTVAGGALAALAAGRTAAKRKAADR
jgi:UPF0716 family protein affecting phage T7 exclusion